ncbi:MAG TPA: hypothetical protein VF272_03425 [Candidatus Saccharimonadia bacterium]
MTRMNPLGKPVYAFLAATILVLTAFTVYTSAVTIELLRSNIGGDRLATTIVRAGENLNRPLVIEPLSGKAYIPAAKLVLPAATDSLGEVLYRYYPPVNGSTAELYLASKSDMRSAEIPLLSSKDVNGLFATVPTFQACGRGIHITFQPEKEGAAVATKRLGSGTTAYFYDEPKCQNPDLLDYAKQITSY